MPNRLMMLLFAKEEKRPLQDVNVEDKLKAGYHVEEFKALKQEIIAEALEARSNQRYALDAVSTTTGSCGG